ncbi:MULTISPECIES: MarR family winged helix-turn-helix transcriptional regulator [Niastella]|uniref:MarR family transcriptional regulator n=1 Tax=Niastella soli TaxID=2821487 RepID=A0ABS3YP47_9BACT|nr:MarR family transcriptional regulator [Niastella soli]MBO9199640.1 MarR family transcriptional regulator [Niastella soli]
MSSAMSIEKDIQQSKFRNEYHKTVVNLIFTYNWITEKTKQFFDKGDITSQQYNILRILRGAGKPLSTLQIRQRMLDKMSDTSRIVDRLVKKELVQKVICKTDRRLVDVTITEMGLQLLDKLDSYNEQMDAMLANLTEEDAKMLNHLLDKIRSSE